MGIDPVDGVFFNGDDIIQTYPYSSFMSPERLDDNSIITDIAFDAEGNLFVFDAAFDTIYLLAPVPNNLGKCISDVAELCTGIRGRERAECNRTQQNFCHNLFEDICGNGIVEPGEECDTGAANANEPNFCRTNCTLPFCGDGILDTDFGFGDERCDDGNNVNGDGCDNDCNPTGF